MGCFFCKKKITNRDDNESLKVSLKNLNDSKNRPCTSEMKEKLTYYDFESLKLIGKGTFGRVLLVKKKDNNKLYAMKILQKNNIIKTKQEEHTKTERLLMERVNCPFIVSLIYAFQDESQLYLVTEFMQGGELYYHLQHKHFFDNELVKFYAAEIVMALSYIHKSNFIYRDLKPENVLMDKEGHLKLTDFGLSKLIKNQKTYTICGSPQYIAPEILLDKGYDKTVDFWSLGILIYEMICGKFPFAIPRNQPLTVDLYKQKITFDNMFTPEAKKIVEELLVFNYKKRLGYGSEGVENIKKHPFFKGIEWQLLEERKIKPSFTPILENDTDLSYFDKIFTKQKLIEPQNKNRKSKEIKIFEGFSFKNPFIDEFN